MIDINISTMTDEQVEEKWKELADIPFDENKDGSLCIALDWWIFHKGEERENIWRWFDKHHSKGVQYLLYEYQNKDKEDY